MGEFQADGRWRRLLRASYANGKDPFAKRGRVHRAGLVAPRAIGWCPGQNCRQPSGEEGCWRMLSNARAAACGPGCSAVQRRNHRRIFEITLTAKYPRGLRVSGHVTM